MPPHPGTRIFFRLKSDLAKNAPCCRSSQYEENFTPFGCNSPVGKRGITTLSPGAASRKRRISGGTERHRTSRICRISATSFAGIVACFPNPQITNAAHCCRAGNKTHDTVRLNGSNYGKAAGHPEFGSTARRHCCGSENTGGGPGCAIGATCRRRTPRSKFGHNFDTFK